MKKFQLNVSVTRTQGIDAVVTTSGDFTASEVKEAIGIVKEAIITEDDEDASYSGSVRVFDSETEAEDVNIGVSKANKATIMAVVSFLNNPSTEAVAATPVKEDVVATETVTTDDNAKESDEQQ